MHNGVEAKVREFIARNFLYSANADSISRATSFLDAGLIDSTGVLELVSFLEKAFSIHIDDADLVPENLDSISRIDAFVYRKRSGQGVLQPVNSAAEPDKLAQP